MKVGDYVRTKDGLITKFEREDDIFYVFDKMISTDKDINRYVNISPNIMELIEAEDYVNGKKVIKNCLKDGGNIILFEDGTCAHNNDIKSIVTHEQFSQMEYKVGD